MVTMEHKKIRTPQLSKVHLTNLKFNNFKIIVAMALQNYCFEVLLNGITCAPNFMKIYQAVQMILVGDVQTDRLVIR
jgi:hypothetical protein